MIRWGILGAGAVAAKVAPDIAATPGNALHAVGARSAEQAAAFAAAHGVARSYGSYAELLADARVDVVYVATTHGQHHEHALAALRAGKPVLVEKAFALNAGQAQEIVDEATTRGLFCMEAMWLRFHPLVRRAVEIARSGRIGDVLGVRADLSRLFPYDPAHRLFDLAAGGGALLDLGVYPATFTWLVLGRPDTVHATGTLAPTGADLTVAMQWGYADGRVAQIYASAAGTSPLAAIVTGTGGYLSLEPRVHHPDRLLVHDDAGDEVITAPPAPGNGYRAEIAEVTRCLEATLSASPEVPPADTVAILAALDEARRQVGARYPGED